MTTTRTWPAREKKLTVYRVRLGSGGDGGGVTGVGDGGELHQGLVSVRIRGRVRVTVRVGVRGRISFTAVLRLVSGLGLRLGDGEGEDQC